MCASNVIAIQGQSLAGRNHEEDRKATAGPHDTVHRDRHGVRNVKLCSRRPDHGVLYRRLGGPRNDMLPRQRRDAMLRVLGIAALRRTEANQGSQPQVGYGSPRSPYVRYNIVGIGIAVLGFVIGSLGGTMGGGRGVRNTIALVLVLVGATIAVRAYWLERKLRKQASSLQSH